MKKKRGLNYSEDEFFLRRKKSVDKGSFWAVFIFFFLRRWQRRGHRWEFWQEKMSQ